MPTRIHALFDPANLGADLSVTQGGEVLQIDAAGLSTARTGRGTVGVISGAWYAEFVVWGEFDALAGAVGMVTADASLAVQVGEDQYGYGYDLDAGLIRFNGATVASVATAVKGDIIGLLVDLDQQQVTFLRNGTALHTETIDSSLSAETWYIAVSLGSGSEADLRCFVNTGRRAFEYPQADADGWYSIPPTISTVRLSIGDYISEPGDTPPNTSWDPVISDGQLTIVALLDFWPWGGSGRRGSAAQLTILDPDGVYDDLVGTNVRDLEVLIDEVDQNGPLSGAVRVARFVVERVSVLDDGRKRLTLRDSSATLDLPVQRRLFLPSLPEDVANRPVPIRLGVCRSVEPILIDPNGGAPIYQVADEPLQGLGTLRDKGDPLTLSVDWSVQTGAQRIALTNNPIGKLTGDFSSIGGASVPVSVVPSTLADWDTVSNVTGTTTYTFGPVITGVENAVIASLEETVALTAGETYRYTIQIDSITAAVGALGNFCRLLIGQGLSASPLVAFASFTTPGLYTGTFTATVTGPISVYLRGVAGVSCSAVVSRLQVFPSSNSVSDTLQPISFADFVLEIMQRAGIASGRWSQADADAIDAATGYGLGYSATEPVSVGQALAAALRGYCASVYEDRDGVLRFARLQDPAGMTPAGEIGEDDMLGDLALDLDTAPGLTAQIAGRRNWTVLDPTDFVTDYLDVPIATRKRLSRPYQVVRTTGVQLPSEYAHARGAAEPLPTLIDEPASLQAEIDRVCALYAVPRFFYGVRVPIDNLPAYALGECWTLRYPRYGLSAGKPCMLVGITEDRIAGTATLRLWG